MRTISLRLLAIFIVSILSGWNAACFAQASKVVVLTFDDASASHFTVVRPLLQKFRFSATFFVTEGMSFKTDKKSYMTWEQIAELHRDGFEIGSHTRDHVNLLGLSPKEIREQVESLNASFEAHRITQPVSFAYPENGFSPHHVPLLEKLGFRFARRGGEPERPYKSGEGVPYDPRVHHRLLLPSAGDARPHWTVADFARAVESARDGTVPILQFHGVPDSEHPWVSTSPGQLEEYFRYLVERGYKAVALRDIESAM